MKISVESLVKDGWLYIQIRLDITRYGVFRMETQTFCPISLLCRMKKRKSVLVKQILH